jgi:hypothetical protein
MNDLPRNPLMKMLAKTGALTLALMLAACGGGEEQAAEPGPADSAATAATPAPAPTVVTCDDSCLVGMVDRYVAALVAHDPRQAPFAANARFTENTVHLALGDGLWGTASALPGPYQIKVGDSETGNAAFYLIMQESGSPIWLSGRLHVSNGQIDELETVVIRQGLGGSGFGAYDLTEVDPEWFAEVPPEQRNTRAELYDVADRYVETLDADLAGHVQFDPSCNRIENGVITANNPQATQGPGAQSCEQNVDSGMWVYITDINPRRFLVADEERGIVMGMFMFHQDGSHDHAMVNGERVEYSGATRRPFTTVIPEMFKVRDGRITRIIATMASIPYKSKSGWDE